MSREDITIKMEPLAILCIIAVVTILVLGMLKGCEYSAIKTVCTANPDVCEKFMSALDSK